MEYHENLFDTTILEEIGMKTDADRSRLINALNDQFSLRLNADFNPETVGDVIKEVWAA